MASQITKVLPILKKVYPNARIVLNYDNNWELLVSVILSAQCTDKKVNEVTAELWKKFRERQVTGNKLQARVKTEQEAEITNFATIPLAELEQDIKSTGFYRNKAKNIQGAARKILENFGGKIPRTMEELLTLPGVARKTANIVLGNAYGIISGIAVDTHVQRVTQRLRLVDLDNIGGGKKPIYFGKNSSVIPAKAGIHTNNHDRFRVKPGMTGGDKLLDYYKDASPEKIEQQLMKVVPKNDWFNFTYWVIEHGRAICKAQNPVCSQCPLQQYCPTSRV